MHVYKTQATKLGYNYLNSSAFPQQSLEPAQEADVKPCSPYAWITERNKLNKDVLWIQSAIRQGCFVWKGKDLRLLKTQFSTAFFKLLLKISIFFHVLSQVRVLFRRTWLDRICIHFLSAQEHIQQLNRFGQ